MLGAGMVNAPKLKSSIPTPPLTGSATPEKITEWMPTAEIDSNVPPESTADTWAKKFPLRSNAFSEIVCPDPHKSPRRDTESVSNRWDVFAGFQNEISIESVFA